MLFAGRLAEAGGAERLLLEEAVYFKKSGLDVSVLTFKLNEQVLFNNTYPAIIEQVGRTTARTTLHKCIQFFSNVISLRAKIRIIDPDVILATSAIDCATLYLATLLSTKRWATHIHGTKFWFASDLTKFALIHKKVFNTIRDSVIGHKEFIPAEPPQLNPIKRVLIEIFALIEYFGVRKSTVIFVLSNQMKWEVRQLYKKDAIVLKGAYPNKLLNYKPKIDIKKQLHIDGRMILNVNRLDLRKRVDVLIRSFESIYDKHDDVTLVIGGTGPDAERLHSLAAELDIQARVKFVGFIEEAHLWDWLASCDVFVHPNWAEFAIAALEPLALQKKVVWSTEMEMDDILSKNPHIFIANPTVDGFASAIELALDSDVRETYDMSAYTWEVYCEKIKHYLGLSS
jgi:glycosyltransferase involved in cell wall biosynthesis